jgi:hypothetical protein
MTLTSTTARHVMQWRAFIGPPYLPVGHAAHWDWSVLNEGDAYTPTPIGTSLTDNLALGGTVATLPSGATISWPAAGGFWVGPNGAGQSWEYVTYTGKAGNTLTGLVRETHDAEQTGVHSSGAAVRFWWPVDTCDGTLHFTERMTDNLAAVGWSAEIRGHKIQQAALRNGHLVLVQIREATTAGWSDWTNALVGWISNPKARDTAGGQAWSLQITGLDGVLSKIQARGVRVGRVNLAVSGTVASSPALSFWYKEAGRELLRNDATTGDMTLDSDPKTKYISEKFIGSANIPADARLDQIHISPYVGQSKGYRWIQYRMGDAGVGLKLRNQHGYYPGPDSSGISPDAARSVPVLVCENAQLCRAENPEYGDAYFYEVSTKALNTFHGSPPVGYDADDWWDSFAPEGGGLCVGGTTSDTAKCLWGNVNVAAAESAWGGTGAPWSGPVLPALNPGDTIRRIHASGAFDAAGYTVGLSAMPGYYVEAIEGGVGDERLWLLYQTPPMGLQLTNAITDSSPGNGQTLYISSADGPSTDGLDASGTLQVGLEQITYSAKAANGDGVVVTARGANGTTAAAHQQATTVYAVDGSGEAVEAKPVYSIGWERESGEPYPTDFYLLASKYSVVRTPDEDPSFANDYDTLATVTGHATNTWEITLGTPTRYRYILLLVKRMSVDPYRLCINRFRVNGDSAVYSTASFVVGGTVADVAGKVLDYAGVPSGAQLVAAGGDNTPADDDHTTAPDDAWAVLTDLANFAGCRVTVGRDSKITIERDPFWAATLPPFEVENWTKVTASALEVDWASGRDVGQVSIEWRLPDGTKQQDPVKYPAVQDDFGSVVHMGPLAYANLSAAQAAAQKRYWMLRRPFSALIEAVGAPWNTHAGQFHGLLWQLDSDMLPLDRTYMVRSVDHEVSDHLTTVVHLLQVSREDER